MKNSLPFFAGATQCGLPKKQRAPRNPWTLFFTVSLVFTLIQFTAQAQTRYVKAGGTGNGSSWANASGNLQDMINGSAAGNQVWVAAGTYKPTTGTDRAISFKMKEGVAIYGGFTGTETSLTQRPAITFAKPASSILSGDIGTIRNTGDNSYHVIYNYGNNLSAAAILDGFIIRDGNANADFNVVRNGNRGGGLVNIDASPTILNCSFTANQADSGGALEVSGSNTQLKNCVFLNNSSFDVGGAISSSGDSNLSIINTIFNSNYAANKGGAIYSAFSTINITNCSFSSNATGQISGIIADGNSSNINITNSILWRNLPPLFSSDASSIFSVSYSDIDQDGYEGQNNNISQDPQFVDADNGDLRVPASSPVINKGNNAANTTSTDLDGKTRIFGPTIDMGAFEYQGQPCLTTTITKQPQAAVVCVGSTATFTVEATGTNLIYKWKKEGESLNNNSPSLILNNVQAAQAGSYSVEIIGDCGTVTSNAVALTVNIAPVITAQPANAIVCEGATAVYSVAVTGTPAPRIQWQLSPDAGGSWVDIGSNSSTVSLLEVTTRMQQYLLRAVVSNTCNSITSNAATLIVNPAPAITTQPVAAIKCAGEAVSFSVSATGSGLTYQWQKNGTAIAGATNASYQLSAVSSADAGNYAVEVSSDCSTITSEAVALTINAAPVITTQPVAVTKCSGEPASFTVAAAGTNLTYQWKKNGVTINGATAASYQLSTVSTADAGSYSVEVSSKCGASTSDAALLTVNAAPAITAQPVGAVKCAGEVVNFNVEASGTDLSYQWQKNGINISGATASTYSIAATNASDAANYSVAVSNDCGTITSQVATLTIKSALVLGTFSAPAAPVAVNTSLSLSITFSGSTVSSATWNWGDGTSSPATISGGTISGSHPYPTAGTYAPILTVIDACGQTTSATYEYVVVYVQEAGCITGAGGYISPKNAYKAQASLTGKAVFGLFARYQKGTTTPEGSTLFAFKAGRVNLAFASTVYETLTIAGSKARYTGRGKINGQGNYGFLVSLIDGRPDKFRIKIWNKDKGNAVVYDNNVSSTAETADPVTAIAGFIVIQAGQTNARYNLKEVEMPVAEAVPSSFKNYPNPFSEKTTLEFIFNQAQEYSLVIYDVNGRLVQRLPAGKAQAGERVQVEWNAVKQPTGIYLLRLTTNHAVQQLKLLKE